jgi:hypothetical protein
MGYLCYGVAMNKILVAIAIAVSSCSRAPTDPEPPDPVECITDIPGLGWDYFRRSVFWPTLAGSPECPLPADHPKCIAGTDPYCR